LQPGQEYLICGNCCVDVAIISEDTVKLFYGDYSAAGAILSLCEDTCLATD
jgi:hypothetical protein